MSGKDLKVAENSTNTLCRDSWNLNMYYIHAKSGHGSVFFKILASLRMLGYGV